MKKVITIEYEPDSDTPECFACPFRKLLGCDFVSRIGLDCEKVNLKDISISDGK